MLIMEIQTSFSRHWEAAESLQKQDDLECVETSDQDIMSLCHFFQEEGHRIWAKVEIERSDYSQRCFENRSFRA